MGAAAEPDLTEKQWRMARMSQRGSMGSDDYGND